MPSSSLSTTTSVAHLLPVITLCSSLVTNALSSFRLSSSSLNFVRLQHVFDMFDHDNNGEISLDELFTALTLLGLSSDVAVGDLGIADAIASFIPLGHAELDFFAFRALHNALNDALDEVSLNSLSARESPTTCEDEEAEMPETFKVFDMDGDKYILAYELQVVLQKLGLSEWRCIDQVEQMIQSIDRDQDGRVDFEEFQSMMESIKAKNNKS